MRGQMVLMFQSINDPWYDYAKLCTGILTQAQCGIPKHCDTQVRQFGFKPIGEDWPSMRYHEAMKLLHVVQSMVHAANET